MEVIQSKYDWIKWVLEKVGFLGDDEKQSKGSIKIIGADLLEQTSMLMTIICLSWQCN